MAPHSDFVRLLRYENAAVNMVRDMESHHGVFRGSGVLLRSCAVPFLLILLAHLLLPDFFSQLMGAGLFFTPHHQLSHPRKCSILVILKKRSILTSFPKPKVRYWRLTSLRGQSVPHTPLKRAWKEEP
jgi:hypothetical protein